jgi:FlaA1/EpsC-like NDP-sugar epimerase
MTIEEAAGLVVEAAHLASDGEIFVLDMGEPVRILDIAQSFAHLMHRADIEVRFTGMRPGEKLNESLFSEHESPLPTAHPRIFRTTSDQRVAGLHRQLRMLYDTAARNDAEAVRGLLRRMLPDYHPDLSPMPAQRGALYPDDY